MVTPARIPDQQSRVTPAPWPEEAPASPLHQTPDRGRLTGFTTLFRKEAGAWFSTRRWWVHALLWLGLMNGLMLPVYFTLQASSAAGPNLVAQLTQLFFALGGTTVAIGAAVVGQDAIIGERQAGTAAWILAKPVGRAAFVLSKLAALFISLAALAVGLQAPIAYAQIAALAGVLLDPVPFLVAVGLILVNLLFHVALVLMLGTWFRARSLVLLVSLGWQLASPLLFQMAPGLAHVAPAGLPDIAAALNHGMPLADLPLRPVALALGWTVVFLAVGIRRFEHEEL